jgi:ferric-dicitrate binding protein FerR (iron transport regulator)
VVVLEEGEVQVSLPDRDTPFQLVPGDYIRYSKGDHNIERGSVVTEGFTSWKDNYILLDNKTLGDLAQIITTVYGRKVVFKNETDKQIILEGKVPSDEIHVLVKALRLATKLNISMEGDVVFIN